MKKKVEFVKQKIAFTLVELIIVIAIITLIAGIVVITINPSSLFANGRNSQRAHDLSTLQTAVAQYLAGNPQSGVSRSLNDIHGYNSLLNGATEGKYICPNGSNGNGLNSLTSYMNVDTLGPNILDMSILLNNGNLPKIPKDPSGNSYRACIDTNNNSQLVLYSPVTENNNIIKTTLNLPTSLSGISNGLVGYWPLNESSGASTQDLINSNNGTAIGGIGISSGKFGNARSFNGGNSYLDMGNSSILYPTSQLTLSSWIYSNDNYSNASIAGPWDLGNLSDNGYIMFVGQDVYNNKFQFCIIQSDNTKVCLAPSSLSYNANQWYHVVGVADGNLLHIYLNGVDSTETVPYNGTIKNSGVSNFSVGRINADMYYFNGLIDEVRLYNRGLSSKEVSSLYDWGAGPVSFYSFDESSGNTVNDLVGINNGSWNGSGQHWGNGKYNGGGNFNGTNDFVSTSSTVYESPSATWETWVKFNNFNLSGSLQQMVLYQADNSGSHETRIMSNTSGNIQWLVYNTSYACNLTGSTILNAGQWYHIAATYGTSGCNLYINGNLDAFSAGTGSPGTGATGFAIGHLNWTGNGLYNGSVDDVKIYNYPRTIKQIQSDMI